VKETEVFNRNTLSQSILALLTQKGIPEVNREKILDTYIYSYYYVSNIYNTFF